MDPEEAEARIDAQRPLAEKARLADYVIPNESSLEDLAVAVTQLYDRLCADHEAKSAGNLAESLCRKAEAGPTSPSPDA